MTLKILPRFWPEFGRNGKDEVTIEDVLRHEAGLPFFQQTIMQKDLVSYSYSYSAYRIL